MAATSNEMKARNERLKLKFKELNSILEHLDMSSVIAEMFEVGVITPAENVKLHEIRDPAERSKYFLAKLHDESKESKHPAAFVQLREAIGKERAYQWLTRRLDETTPSRRSLSQSGSRVRSRSPTNRRGRKRPAAVDIDEPATHLGKRPRLGHDDVLAARRDFAASGAASFPPLGARSGSVLASGVRSRPTSAAEAGAGDSDDESEQAAAGGDSAKPATDDSNNAEISDSETSTLDRHIREGAPRKRKWVQADEGGCAPLSDADSDDADALGCSIWTKDTNDVLRLKFKKLFVQMSRMCVDSIIDRLISQFILTEAEYEEIKNPYMNWGQMPRKLLIMLHKSGHPEAFIKLREAIAEERALSWVLDELDNTVLDDDDMRNINLRFPQPQQLPPATPPKATGELSSSYTTEVISTDAEKRNFSVRRSLSNEWQNADVLEVRIAFQKSKDSVSVGDVSVIKNEFSASTPSSVQKAVNSAQTNGSATVGSNPGCDSAAAAATKLNDSTSSVNNKSGIQAPSSTQSMQVTE